MRGFLSVSAPLTRYSSRMRDMSLNGKLRSSSKCLANRGDGSGVM
jgi:hypothetical protein